MSTFIDWIPALSSTSILAILIFCSKKLIVTRLTNAVKHEYDSKLELLKGDLSKKEQEINSIRNVGLSGLQQRQSLLFERQLGAIELLWSSTCKLSHGIAVSKMMLRVKTDEVSKSIEQDQKLQEFFKMIAMHVNMDKLGEINPTPARPFVSKLAWAYYSAYSSIIYHYVLQAKLFENGIGQDFLDKDNITTLVRAALPHQNKFIEEFGADSFGHLLEELQGKILEEIDAMLSGKSLDQAGLEKAAVIQDLAQELSDKN